MEGTVKLLNDALRVIITTRIGIMQNISPRMVFIKICRPQDTDHFIILYCKGSLLGFFYSID